MQTPGLVLGPTSSLFISCLGSTGDKLSGIIGLLSAIFSFKDTFISGDLWSDNTSFGFALSPSLENEWQQPCMWVGSTKQPPHYFV